MAVCAQCGASTSARRCPRCGGETTPYAKPRPESERPAPVLPPAGTTVHLPRLAREGRYPDLPRAGDATGQAADPDATQVHGITAAPPAAPPPAAPSSSQSPPDAVRPPAPQPAADAHPHPRSGATASAANPSITHSQSPFTGRTATLVALAIAVLLALGCVVWWLMHRDRGIETVTPTAPARVAVQLPGGATACAGSDAPTSGYQVFVGNPATTCSFAENLAVTLGGQARPVKLDVFSPKAGRAFDMTCEGDAAVTCHGGNGAVVYLVPQSSKAILPSSAPS